MSLEPIQIRLSADDIVEGLKCQQVAGQCSVLCLLESFVEQVVRENWKR